MPKYIVVPNIQEGEDQVYPHVKVVGSPDVKEATTVLSKLERSAVLIRPAFSECNALSNPSFHLVVQNLSNDALEVSLKDIEFRAAGTRYELLDEQSVIDYVQEKARKDKWNTMLIGIVGSAAELHAASKLRDVYTGGVLQATLSAPAAIDEIADAEIQKYKGRTYIGATLKPGENHGGLVVVGNSHVGKPFMLAEQYTHLTMSISLSMHNEVHEVSFDCKQVEAAG